MESTVSCPGCSRPMEQGSSTCRFCGGSLAQAEVRTHGAALALPAQGAHSTQGARRVTLAGGSHEAPTALPGNLADRYEVLRPLGQGGMGAVLLARDRVLAREVALKLVLELTHDGMSRFELEAKVLASLEDEHIVRIYDFGVAGGKPYLVMEYVRGSPLNARLARGRPSMLEAARLAVDILTGISLAHARGIAHRDLKPANVFLDAAGRAKVADFGLARILAPPAPSPPPSGVGEDAAMAAGVQVAPATGTGGEVSPAAGDTGAKGAKAARTNDDGATGKGAIDQAPMASALPAAEARTSAGAVMGTPGYMAPEQARGKEVGPAADVYSLGIILFEMLTGRRLFTGDGPYGILRAQLAWGFWPPSRINPSVPPALDDIVRRALDPDPQARATAADLLRSLSLWLERSTPVATLAQGLPSHPYKLLSPFRREDQAIFFGREAEIAEIASRIERPDVRVLMLFGPSGIGKSSLLRAGLARGLDPLRTEIVLVLSGADPAGALIEGLAGLMREWKVSLAGGGLVTAATLALSPGLLDEAVASLVRQTGRTLVLVVDQLEEVFTHNPGGSPTQDAFFTLVTRLAESQQSGVKLVLAFRTEFRGDLFGLEERLGPVTSSLAVGEMTAVGLAEAIEGPSRFDVYRFRYAAGIAQRLAGEVLATARRESIAALPILQIVGHQLYEATRTKGQDAIDADLLESALGGVSGALQRFVEERLDGPGYAGRRGMARQMLTALTVKEEGGERYALARSEEDLSDFPDAQEARRVLERLIADRLVVREEDAGDRRRVRLASEAVCPLIDAWVLEPDDVERAARILARAHRQWQEQDRRSENLLTGVALDLVRRQLPSLREVGPEQLAYLNASLAAARRRRVKAGTLVVCVLAMASLMIYRTWFQPGTLRLTPVPAGAQILCDGAMLGHTSQTLPTLIAHLSPGVHSLVLRNASYEPARITVNVPAGGEVAYEPVLKYPRGLLGVVSDPPGARCEVRRANDRAAGPSLVATTPFSLEIPEGRYALSISRSGCVTWVSPIVEVKPNREVTPVQAVLERNTGALLVGSPFEGVTMTVRRGETGPFVAQTTLPCKAPLELPAGHYVIECRREGNRIDRRAIDVPRGRTRVLTAWAPPIPERWRGSTGAQIRAAPQLADLDGDGVPDAVAADTREHVLAVSGATGQMLLSTRVPGLDFRSVEVSDLGTGAAQIIVGAKDRAVGLSARTGGMLWSTPLPGRVHGRVVAVPATPGSTPVACVPTDTEVAALDARTGAVLWKRVVFAKGGPWPSSMFGISLALAGGGTRLLVASDTHVQLLSMRDGRVIWSHGMGETLIHPPIPIPGAPGEPSDVLGVAGHSLARLAGRTGQPIWSLPITPPTSADFLLTEPILARGGHGEPIAVTGTTRGRLLAVDLARGTARELVRCRNAISADPVLVDLDGDGVEDVVAVDSRGRLVAVSGATGKIFLDVSTGMWAPHGPLVADLDGDGVSDLIIAGDGAVDAYSVYKTGLVEAYSGRTGRAIFSLRLPGTVWNTPALANLGTSGIPDLVVTAADGTMRALDLTACRARWAFQAHGTMRCAPAFADLDGDGIPDVIVGTRDKCTYALSGATGSVLWTHTSTAIVDATPAVADLDGDGVPDAIIASDDSHVYAVSGRTGRVLWSAATGDPVEATPAVADLDGDGVPDVIVGSTGHTLWAFSGRDGHVLWKVDSGAAITGRVAVADLDGDGRPDVIAGTREGRLIAVSGAHGHPLWTARTRGPIAGAPALADLDGDGVSDVIVGSHDGAVHAFSGKTGAPLWESALGGQIWATPAVADLGAGPEGGKDHIPSVIAVAVSGRVEALAGRDGHPLWTAELGSEVYASPLVVDVDGDGIPDVVLGLEAGRLAILSGRTGKPLARLAATTWLAAPLVEWDVEDEPLSVTDHARGLVFAMARGTSWLGEGGLQGPRLRGASGRPVASRVPPLWLSMRQGDDVLVMERLAWPLVVGKSSQGDFAKGLGLPRR